jgi:N-acetylglutamate synthase-like GNAT family acetyltransferase
MRPQIRDASPFDIPALLDMLRQYRDQTPLPFLAEADDAIHMTHVLAQAMAGKGVVLVAETDKIDGMLIAGIAPSLWSPKHLVMTEMAYWVNPDARGTTAGYRLLSAYVEHGQALKDQGRIAAFFISKMVNSPDLKYQKFGFTKLEEFWVI